MSIRAIITGITGQDGAYLAQHLLDDGQKVFGTFRRNSSINFWRLESLGLLGHPNLKLLELDVTDVGATFRLLETCKPHEVYNLAAQSFVGVSFDQPATTAQITGIGALNLLEAIRTVDRSIKFYQASTSEMFGLVQEVPQRENTPFYPRSPYGVAKLFAHWTTINYRESYDLFATSGILFNHESPLRGQEFVTRKITDGVARIAHGSLDTLELGNLSASRDWGFARDYVRGMVAMMRAERAGDYVLATGKTTTIRDFAEMAFAAANIAIEWRDSEDREKGYDAATGQCRVRVNPRFYRPAEVDCLQGDASLARDELSWEPHTQINDLCKMMVEADIQRVACDKSF
jgi:GDPmannose 4,6-dehydratase